jgi:hypothetical protein
MAIDNLLARIIAQIGKNDARNRLLSNFAPPSYDDVLHDGLVGSGQTLGGILGTTMGALGGEAIGGPRGALAGSALLGPVGTLAGGWAAHGGYREGQLIGNILSHPENWSVDAAGAIVPVTPAPNPPSTPNESNDANARYLSRVPKTADSGSPPLPSGGAIVPPPQSPQSGVGTVDEDTAPPVRFQSSRQQNPLGDGMTGWRSSVDPTDPQYATQPAPSPQRPGGLLGLLLDHLRDNPNI